MRLPWRFVFLLCAIALGAMVFFMIRSNLRSDAFLAAVRSKDVAAVRRVLERQPDVITTPVMPQGSQSNSNRVRWLGRMPMHVVVSDITGGSTELAETLLAFGADFKVRLNGDTLLHLASQTGDLAMMTWLLDKGADINARNACEHPAEAICGSGEFDGWQPSDRRRDSGTVCRGCDHEGQTPLHAAQRASRAFEASTLLLARGADVHAVDVAGRTALHVAGQSASGSHDPRVLCAYGADPAARDRQGKTAADLAREADAAKSVDRYSSTGPGELAGWLQAGGGCSQIAARVRPGAPVPMDDVDAAWRAYVCTRDAKWCEKQ
jgi:Ankyrin repeats (3 copies)/Ankyrin repeat